ncbi:MAG: GNAT family N-acetyltransferase [Gammaproteobacteria bacterium]|nr:GNAT family N-acetyltransferase [Gammaproteobacteria bacterium]
MSIWQANKKMIKIRKQITMDSEAVKSIIKTATDELRAVYHPIKTKVKNEIEKPISIVAIIKDHVVGFAEYLIYENSILVRGLAVSPVYRRQGVARTIIQYLILKAKKEGKTELALSTIKETGNTIIFLHMGFTIVSEELSELFEDVHGEQVILVNMTKKIG